MGRRHKRPAQPRPCRAPAYRQGRGNRWGSGFEKKTLGTLAGGGPPGAGVPGKLCFYEPMVLVFHKPAIILVFYKLNSAIERGHEARRVGLKAMPLDQHIGRRPW